MNPDSKEKKVSAKRYLANLQGEIDSAAFYRALVEIENRPEIARVYRKMAEVEESHAELWKKRLSLLGYSVPDLRSRRRARALLWLARRFGPGFVLPIATSLERGGSWYYDIQPEAKVGGLAAADFVHRRTDSLGGPASSGHGDRPACSGARRQ